jgi:pSer/pThr/pTyr-binding forkhead associated (FHA) protein
MLAKLTCKSGQLSGNVYFVKDETVIGSNPGSAIYLRSGVISSKHARIFYDKRKRCYVVEDLKSFNGTRLDGENIHGKKRLRTYHVIVLANTFEFVFQVVPDEEEVIVEPPPKAEPAPEEDRLARTIVVQVEKPAPPPPPPSVATRSDLYLEFKTVKTGKQVIRLKSGGNTVGRSANSDVVIDNPSISRHHAVITIDGSSIRVSDEGSRNGTFVDDRRITEEYPLTPQSELRFGLVNAMLIVEPTAPEENSIPDDEE